MTWFLYRLVFIKAKKCRASGTTLMKNNRKKKNYGKVAGT